MIEKCEKHRELDAVVLYDPVMQRGECPVCRLLREEQWATKDVEKLETRISNLETLVSKLEEDLDVDFDFPSEDLWWDDTFVTVDEFVKARSERLLEDLVERFQDRQKVANEYRSELADWRNELVQKVRDINKLLEEK